MARKPSKNTARSRAAGLQPNASAAAALAAPTATTRYRRSSRTDKMPAMLPRRLLSWLFALTLLFGQAAAFAHALTHLRTHDTGLPDKVCEICLAQAQLGTALPPSLVVLAMPP